MNSSRDGRNGEKGSELRTVKEINRAQCLLFFYFLKFIYFILFLAALGLHCCARAFSSWGERGLLFVAVHRLLIAVASLVAERGL